MVEFHLTIRCDEPNCEESVEHVSPVSVDVDEDHDSFGGVTRDYSLNVTYSPEGWGDETRFGTQSFWCPNHRHRRTRARGW